MSNIGTLLTVDGVQLPNPSKYEMTYSDLDSQNAYTSEAGYLVRDMVRSNHITIDVSWDKIKPTQTKLILNAVSGKSSFKLRFYDKKTNSFIEEGAKDSNGVARKFYATDRKTGVIKAFSLANGYDSLSFQIIEF